MARHGLGPEGRVFLPDRAVLANGGAVMPDPTDDQIRTRAHQLWEQAGKPQGREDEFWHQAEKELQEEKLREVANEPPPTILPG